MVETQLFPAIVGEAALKSEGMLEELINGGTWILLLVVAGFIGFMQLFMGVLHLLCFARRNLGEL